MGCVALGGAKGQRAVPTSAADHFSGGFAALNRVMAGLVPAIHDLFDFLRHKTWMPAT
jgi:hypothetical protein